MDRYARYTKLKFDRPHPHTLRITITTDTKHNFMDADMHRELGEVWRDIDVDESVSAVLLTAAGASFSAGGNIKRASDTYEFEERARTMKEAHNIVYNMINCSKPIVSAVRGWAVGAGLACALLADISIVTKDAKLLDGHTRLGIAAGDHAVMLWPLLCGMAQAKYYLLLCDQLSGADAERIGLVTMAVEDDELEQKSLDIAIRLAEGAPSAIRWTKYALNNWFRQAGPIFDTSLALEMIGFFGPEVKEGRSAVNEKRPAKFEQEIRF
ncbi:enoyl-CoA hydratase/isomerase family protein [Cupriavidus basilensis]